MVPRCHLPKSWPRGRIPETVIAKLARPRTTGCALEIAAPGGGSVAYGTDLLGPMHRHQLREFAIARPSSGDRVIRSATCMRPNFPRDRPDGNHRAGPRAALVVDGKKSLEDLGCLQDPSAPPAIMKDGVFYKNRL